MVQRNCKKTGSAWGKRKKLRIFTSFLGRRSTRFYEGGRREALCKVPSPLRDMTAIISHFKFVAGMNVGEKRRSQLGSCDYPLEDGSGL